jgi:hypothetical protein
MESHRGCACFLCLPCHKSDHKFVDQMREYEHELKHNTLTLRYTSHQGFFSRSRFFTGGHRKNRLPRNLENTADLPNEFFQSNFEFKFFTAKEIEFVSLVLLASG